MVQWRVDKCGMEPDLSSVLLVPSSQLGYHSKLYTVHVARVCVLCTLHWY
jgi:hypothetical protein